MLNDEIIEVLSERLVNRLERANNYILKVIGENIKKIGNIKPKQLYQLQQILKFGGDYNKIAQKLADVTKLNVKDIYEIFEEVAKKEQDFAKKFYDYRNIGYIPYEQNVALQRQVRAIASLTANTYLNISGTLGYALKTPRGVMFTQLSKVYQETIDTGVMSIAQGKETFLEEMTNIIKQLGSSGLKTVDYASGRSVRLDSAVRMNLKDGLRTLHTEMQMQFGEEFGADGIEITVHSYPAPDHELVQGRQFSTIRMNGELSEWEKLQDGQKAKDYKDKEYTLDHDNNGSYRPISKLNCYHTVFDIILGISKPQYDDEYLQKVIDDNEKGFDFENKHYTMYQGTQLQRKIELEIRKTKDIEMMASTAGIEELITDSQKKIRQLTTKYIQLSKISGLPTKIDRMKIANE